MKVIGRMMQLTKLEFSTEKNFTDGCMESLSKLVNLTSLKLWDVNLITGKGLRLLGKLTKLTHFDVNCEGCNTISNEDLVFFHELQELQSFDLYLNHSFILTDEGLQHIAAAQSLRTLDFWRWESSITAVGAKHIERLHQLKSLHLHTLPLPTDATLASLTSLPQLEQLHISSPVTMSEFCALTTLKKLKTLRVSVNGGAGSSTSGVETLDDNVSCLDDFHASNANDIILQRISMINSLTVLHVEDSPSITDDGVQVVSTLVNLEQLRLTNLAITGSGFNGFGTKLRKLTSLQLQECANLQDHGMHHICELGTLRSLIVKCCGCLSDDAFSTIAKLRNVTYLRILECAGIQCEGGFTEIAWMRLSVVLL